MLAPLPLSVLIAACTVVVMILLLNRAPRGCATRPVRKTGTAAAAPPPASAWYIESGPAADRHPISCSFVEFDQRGDHLDFPQHRHAYEKLRELAKEHPDILVVLYIHGWKNNAQSGDVVEFVIFLHQLSQERPQARVHGVYLGWRGNPFGHALNRKSKDFALCRELFGADIVDARYARWRGPLGWPVLLAEQLSYWGRKNCAEHTVSGLPLIRTIFTLGYAVKKCAGAGTNHVFLLGHSMGALMLEQSFAPASISQLMDEWPWDNDAGTESTKANPLPFDLVLLLNSAAPSIYAKQLFGYMVADRRALSRRGVIGADAPLIISLTSEGDSATGKLHKYGNALARIYPSLRRKYDSEIDFILQPARDRQGRIQAPLQVPQSFYYRHTPGHNPLLVNAWIVERITGSGHDPAALTTDPLRMFDTRSSTGTGTQRWAISHTPPDPAWSSYKDRLPTCLDPRSATSGYWIMRCPKPIIKDHSDIWNERARRTYTQLFTLAQALRTRAPAPYVPAQRSQ